MYKVCEWKLMKWLTHFRIAFQHFYYEKEIQSPNEIA